MRDLKFRQLIKEAYMRLGRVNELLDAEDKRLQKHTNAKKAA